MGSKIRRKGLSLNDLLNVLRRRGIDIKVGEGCKDGISWAVFKYGESLSKKMQEIQELFPREVGINKFLIDVEKDKTFCRYSTQEGRIIINLARDPAELKFKESFQSAVNLAKLAEQIPPRG